MVKNKMIGQYFHSIEKGKVKWQGCILSKPSKNMYLIQLFSWLSGEPTNRQLISIDKMKDWLFYKDFEEMDYSYQYGTASKLKDKYE